MVGLTGVALDEATAAHLAAGGRGLILLGENIGSAGAGALADPRGVLRRLRAAARRRGPGARQRWPACGGLVTPLPTTAEALEMTPEELEITGQLLGDEMLALGDQHGLRPGPRRRRRAQPRPRGTPPGAPTRRWWPNWAWPSGAAWKLAGVVAVPKHFPGHGRAAADPHDEVVRVAATLADLRAVDFLPFAAAVAAGARAIMVGHPIYDSPRPRPPRQPLAGGAQPAPRRVRLRRGGDHRRPEHARGGRRPTRANWPWPPWPPGRTCSWSSTRRRSRPTVAAIVAAVATGGLSLERLQEAASAGAGAGRPRRHRSPARGS